MARTRWRRRCDRGHAQVASTMDFPDGPPPVSFLRDNAKIRAPRRGHQHKWTPWGHLGIFDKRTGRRCTTCSAVQLKRAA